MLTLEAKTREEKPNKVRNEEYLPAVVYGKEAGDTSVKVNLKDFKKIYEKGGESTIINLKVKNDKNKEYPVIIRDTQKDPVSLEFIHADFYQLPMDKEIEVTVPLTFEGEAPVEKELGGIVVKNLHELDIKALPKDLISEIKVDVSSLKTFEDEIKIKDLVVSSGIEILADPDERVVVASEAVEEEITEEPAEERPEEIEVVGEKEGEQEEGEEPAEEGTEEQKQQ